MSKNGQRAIFERRWEMAILKFMKVERLETRTWVGICVKLLWSFCKR